MGIIEKAADRLGQTPREAKQELKQKAQAGGRSKPDPLEPPVMPPVKPLGPRIPADHSQSPSKRVELNLAKLRTIGIVTPDAGKNAISEEFRAIKLNLLDRIANAAARPSNHSNLIMVTSAMPAEGKTFCAINLAMSIAMELDHTVLLVDADVARPAMLRTLGLEEQPGLMDVLADRGLPLGDVMLKTNIDTLSILPAGSAHRHATELLSSQAMSRLLDEIAHRYPERIVIFDSPPLLITTEARVLASRMGQILTVVEAEKTTQKTLKNALRQIEGCPNVSLVYNKAKAFRGGDDYVYYSYYK